MNNLPEADAEHVTKTDLHILEKQMRIGFANVLQQVATSISTVQMRITGITFGGIAIATAILLALG